MNYSKKLSAICKRCLRRNGMCIKDYAYIGWCANNDREELIQMWKEKRYEKEIK